MKFLGLRTTIYKVSDINAAKEWFANAFETTPYFDEPFYVGFNIGGYELGLQPEDVATTEKSDNVVTYWGTDQIDSEYEKLITLGATAHESPNNVEGDIVVASVKDPFGNVIGLIYNPEFTLE
ncbi:VOC family protein [Dyadobacter arcticus]|uniref:Lactoylglutathione lyase n=1 Tax=Dyadobacter arcticus TaxID=1078754 RepID=A0ABX0UWH9_9BACT|nr:VOC family protein [Dyadobacter arcticus]NIJ55281.1 lactoylglutathione lyase [Dyadobacter arcticus]